MADLKRYRQKRALESTPEPFGEEREDREISLGGSRAFVVQQHAARRLHWDLRLEIGGALASWAVPRGPSLDPAERRLAVRTEDHPLEYAEFEGVIPPGNYGAGAMIVWDRGSYRSADGRAPELGLESGKLDLVLRGHKLVGRFALVRTRGAEGRNWLLLRKARAHEKGEEIALREPASVLSGLTVQERAQGVTRDEEIESRLRALRAPRVTLDGKSLRPMLAQLGEGAFSREGWLFELKYDGVRVLVEKADGEARVYARTGGVRTALYPEIANALRHLPVRDFIADGEIVALDESGRSSFELLQRRFTQTDPSAVARLRSEVPVVLYLFDLLGVCGHDLRGLPLGVRKEILARFVPRLGDVRFADHVEGDGVALFAAAEAHGLEGVIAKRADSRYESGQRARSWLKIKAPRRAWLVIVGFLPGKGARRELGSLMLAWHREGKLVYAGNVGSGLDERTIRELVRRLRASALARPAFAGAPDPPVRGTAYTRPELVCEVRYTEVTSAGLLRQPVFLALQAGRSTQDCVEPPERAARVAPKATAAAPEPPSLQLTRLDKVFWPVEGYTKGDLLGYYEAVWPWLAPYLRDRPVVLTRYPDGIEGKHFYQKNAPDFTPDWVEHRSIDGTDYFFCNELRTLLYVINSGAIPLHVWSARLTQLDRPDWLVLDLDPKEAPFRHVVAIARHLHRLLDHLGAPHFVKTSGQDGIHVMLPLAATLEHAEAKTLGEVLARVVVADLPEIATVARPLAARGRKVYVDFLQNGRGKLIAAPFSVRPRPQAPVSMPLKWSQVNARLDPSRWTIRSALRQLRRHGDPLRELLGEPVHVEALLSALAERLAELD